MHSRDATSERVDDILTDAARAAYLGDADEERCFECGEVVLTTNAYSGIDPATGRRGFVCAPCNFDPIHDEEA